MGTRGCIVRITEKGFEGRYHHWDSYPSGLGETLWKLYHGYFNGDLAKMLDVLIKQHKAGWSTINGKDFNLPCGFVTLESKDIDEQNERYKKPECYCHGERKEEEWLVTQDNASGSGCEWVYAFDVEKEMMQILASFNEDRTKMIGVFGCGNENGIWKIVKEVDLDGTEPNWKQIEDNIREESHKTYEAIKKRKKEEFLETVKEGFAQVETLGLIAIPKMHYMLWYNEDVKPHLFTDTKIGIAKRISELTLKSPIWEDKDTNYIDQFPELKPYSNTGKISGLQLCVVMEAIVNEMQTKEG